MRRRDFVTVLAGAAVSWPLAARAQQSAKIARIGWMSRGNASAPDGTMNAFRQGMRELGYAEGQGFVIEPRYADGKAEVMPAQAAELERLGVDVIIAGPFEALQAAKESTSRVPVIMTPSGDPVIAGFVASLEHPSGNITGITEMMPELTPQRLGMLKQIVPPPQPGRDFVAPGNTQRCNDRESERGSARRGGYPTSARRSKRAGRFRCRLRSDETGGGGSARGPGQPDLLPAAEADHRSCGGPSVAGNLNGRGLPKAVG